MNRQSCWAGQEMCSPNSIYSCILSLSHLCSVLMRARCLFGTSSTPRASPGGLPGRCSPCGMSSHRQRLSEGDADPAAGASIPSSVSPRQCRVGAEATLRTVPSRRDSSLHHVATARHFHQLHYVAKIKHYHTLTSAGGVQASRFTLLGWPNQGKQMSTPAVCTLS